MREDPLYSGAFADVWKDEHDGKMVAVRVLRASKGNSERVRKVGSPWIIVRTDKPTTVHAAAVQGGHNMEVAPSSEHPAVVRRRYRK